MALNVDEWTRGLQSSWKDLPLSIAPLIYDPSPSIETPRIRIEVSGELAKNIAELPSIDQRTLSLKASGGLHSVIYHVRVDGETGRLFWYERDRTSSKQVSSFYRTKSLDLLKQIRFIPDPDRIEIEGRIHFIFEWNEDAHD